MKNRRPATAYIKSVRPMVKDDLQFLREKSSRPIIQKLRETHHQIARLASTGMKLNEIAFHVGMSPARVGILRSAPAMQELIARYRAEEDAAFRETRDHYYDELYTMSRMAARQIREQLEEADETGEVIPINKLVSVLDAGADRVGYHRKSTKENINIDFAAKLEAAINRTQKALPSTAPPDVDI